MPGGRQPAQCPTFPLWCKGGKRRREDQAKASISAQQDQDQSNGGKEVIVEPRTASPQGLWQARTNFSQDKCTGCSPSNWPIVGALPAHYLGRGPRPLPINRTSHPQGRGIWYPESEQREREREGRLNSPSGSSPQLEHALARLFSLVLFI